jgi:hypothetical protein
MKDDLMAGLILGIILGTLGTMALFILAR